jgi:hypothetical protein
VENGRKIPRRAWGDAGGSGRGSASHIDSLELSIFLAHHSISHLQKEYRHPFREPLQFIVIAVMSVISGTFPIPMVFST